MPTFNPTRLKRSKVGLPYASWFVSMPTQDMQGVIAKAADGTFSWIPPEQAESVGGGYTVYEIGRGGYYLSMAEAREAVTNSSLHDVSYVDDYNDEYQDYYVCGPGVAPYTPTTIAEPIR